MQDKLARGGVKVPFVDLKGVTDGVKARLLAEIADLVDSGAFTNGPQVEGFEAAYAAYCGASHCVGVASGLDALRLTLLAAGIEEGDEVIVPAMTFAATFEAVVQTGGVPVPVDIDESDCNMDVRALEAALTPRTRFLMPVHLYGQMADVRGLAALAHRHGIIIVEDACQAHGARRDGAGPGDLALGAAFSFYPAKNLGAMGDAGAVVTNDAKVAARVRALREHGQTARYRHDFEGYTARLDTIQALVLLQKLPLLDAWNEMRRAAADFYSNAFRTLGDLRVPEIAAGSRPVWHLYVVRTKDPGRLATFLAARGIGTGRHYPEPPHLSPAYRYLGHRPGEFRVAEALGAEALSLPMFPGITEEQLEVVADAVGAFFHDV